MGLAVVALLAMTLVSCGTEPLTEEAYGTELRSTMGELEEAYGDAIGETAGGGATPADAEELRSAQLALRDAGNRLDEIDPPEGLEDEHADLVSGVRDMADDVTLLVDATELAETDPARAKELTAKFAASKAFRQVGDAASRLDRAGIDAGL